MGIFRPFTRCSAPWTVWGHRLALVKVLRILWTQYLECNGLRVPQDCLVDGLFTITDDEARADGAVEALEVHGAD